MGTLGCGWQGGWEVMREYKLKAGLHSAGGLRCHGAQKRLSSWGVAAIVLEAPSACQSAHFPLATVLVHTFAKRSLKR